MARPFLNSLQVESSAPPVDRSDVPKVFQADGLLVDCVAKSRVDGNTVLPGHHAEEHVVALQIIGRDVAGQVCGERSRHGDMPLRRLGLGALESDVGRKKLQFQITYANRVEFRGRNLPERSSVAQRVPGNVRRYESCYTDVLPTKFTLSSAEEPVTWSAQLAAAWYLVALPFAGASAQGIAHGVIKGFVVGANSAPVPAAIVTLDSSRVQVATDSAGAFTLRDVAVGRHTLTARRLGFAVASGAVTVAASESAAVVLRLEAAPQMLPEVEVRGRKVIDLPRFTAAVERASRNNGAAFTADDIAKENPLDTKSLLERVPGVHVSDRSIMFARCQDSGMLPNRSNNGGGRGGSSSFSPARGPAPRVQVYVDGKRLTYNDDANTILTSINPRSIAVMEVYTGVARIPVDYLVDACAVVAIWTKAY